MSESGDLELESGDFTNWDKLVAFRELSQFNQEYLDECKPLEELFIASREFSENPQAILNIQEQLFNNIFRYQAEKKANIDNEYKVVMYNQLIAISRNIVDAIAWRVLNYDRFLIDIFESHGQTGALVEGSSHAELEKAKEIVGATGNFVILNDLTHFLKYGDLTIVSENDINILEVKNSPKNPESSRISRQRQKLQPIKDFISGKNSFFEFGGYKHFGTRVDVPLDNYHIQLQGVINRARRDGYAVEYLNTYLAVDIIDKRLALELNPTIEDPFGDIPEKRIIYDTIRPNDSIGNSVGYAPFGVFPLKDEDCFALMSGAFRFRTILNVELLEKLYAENGVQFVRNIPSQEDRELLKKAITQNPTGSWDQKQLIEGGFFTHKLIYPEGNIEVKVMQSYFLSILKELSTPEAFIVREMARLKALKRLDMHMEEQGVTNLDENIVHLVVDEGVGWR
jgi:hypothetical protein